MTNIDPTARISPTAEIADGVTIGPFCVIEDDVVIGEGSRVGPYTQIQGPTTIGRENDIIGHASIGNTPQDLLYRGEKTRLEIGDHNTIREFVTINRGTLKEQGVTTVGSHNLIMAYSHIAHDCVIGDHIVLGNLATLAGHVHVEDHVIVGGMCAIHQFVHIGAYAILGGGSLVTLDVVPYAKAQGNRAKVFGLNTIGLKRGGFDTARIRTIREAYRVLFDQGLLLKDALVRLKTDYAGDADIERMVTFIEGASRGLAR